MVKVLPDSQFSEDLLPKYRADKAKLGRSAPTEIQTPPLRKLQVTAVYDVVFEIKP